MSIRTWVGRFSIVEGQVREEGPWLGAFRRQLADEETRDLYVLAEPASPGSEEFCGQLVEVVGRLFQRENLSMTGALLRSLRAAHENLRDWNRKSLPEHQVAAGASCLLLTGRTAYLAQAGPSVAYFYRGGQLTTLTPQEEEAQVPLGEGDELRPDVTRYDLKPGDLLLVASTRLTAIADEPAVAGALARGPDDALPEIFLLTRDLLNFSALLAACFEEAEEPSPEEITVPEHFAARPTDEELSAVGQAGEETRPANGEPLAPPDDGREQQAALWPPTSARVHRGHSARWSGGAVTVVHQAHEQGRGAAVALMAPPTALGLAPDGGGGAARPVTGRALPLGVWENTPAGGGNAYELLIPRVDSPLPGMERPVVRLRGPAATPRHRCTRTTSTLPRLFPVPRLAVLAALAVLIVTLVAWLAVPRSVEQNREETYASLLADARASLQEVRQGGMGDATQRRVLLSGALANLDEAASIYPDDGQARALRLQVQDSLADLDAVVDLGEMRLVADVDLQVAGELSIQHIVVGGGAAFLLDQEGGRVLELPTGEGGSARVVFQQGVLAGSVMASRPLYILWSQPEGDAGRLLVLDDQRHLFSLTPGGTAAPLVLRDSQEWGSLDGAASYGGNLYVLDVASDQVWRYPPTDSGFDSERSGILGDADLSGAQGLVVDRDVYLLTKNGGIRRFAHGAEEPVALAGIDRGLLAPSSVTPDGQGGLVVVDRGNKRLVSLSASGDFQAQFVSRTFTDIRSAAVDSESGLLYVLVGDSLYATEMPQP
jgi:hypothetical protein